MSHRLSVRRLLSCLLLSQALAIQALLLAWSGAQALAAGNPANPAVICAGVAAGRIAGGTEPPAEPVYHQDCLGICLASHADAAAPQPAAARADTPMSIRAFITGEALLLARSRMRAFLARAPPTPT